MVITIIHQILIWSLMGVLVFNLTQRRHLEHGERKRIATLVIAGAILLLLITTIFIREFSLSPYIFLGAVAVVGSGLYYKRDLFPYTRYCVSCKNRLPLKRILYYDSNLCERCDWHDEDA
jgi:hypothetical protein